jgi:hypothetical protein
LSLLYQQNYNIFKEDNKTINKDIKKKIVNELDVSCQKNISKSCIDLKKLMFNSKNNYIYEENINYKTGLHYYYYKCLANKKTEKDYCLTSGLLFIKAHLNDFNNIENSKKYEKKALKVLNKSLFYKPQNNADILIKKIEKHWNDKKILLKIFK